MKNWTRCITAGKQNRPSETRRNEDLEKDWRNEEESLRCSEIKGQEWGENVKEDALWDARIAESWVT